jgi:hypothetical protein
MASTIGDDQSNPFRPPKVDQPDPTVEERASFLAYRRACLDHETFQLCVGVANLLCAGMGAVIVIGSLALVISMHQNDVKFYSPAMIVWMLGRFVLLPTVVVLLFAIGLNLPRRRLWAWRTQIIVSAVVLVVLAVNWKRYRSPDTPVRIATAVLASGVAHAAVIAVFLSKRGFRIHAPAYGSIVAATPSLSRSLTARVIVGAIVLAAPLGLGVLGGAMWISWQAARAFLPLGGQ